MIIKQVIGYFHNPKGNKPIKIHKYHISKGTARRNKWFDYQESLNHGPEKRGKTRKIEFDIEVERVIE